MEQQKQYIAKKFCKTKVKKKDDLLDIILKQFGLSIKYLEENNLKLSASDLYMPEEEQDKMAEWIINNSKIFKDRVPELMREKQMEWFRLDMFPSSVKR